MSEARHVQHPAAPQLTLRTPPDRGFQVVKTRLGSARLPPSGSEPDATPGLHLAVVTAPPMPPLGPPAVLRPRTRAVGNRPTPRLSGPHPSTCKANS